MPSRIDVPGVALITGAASGIGRSVAVEFAAAGCTRFALVGRAEAGLKVTRALIEAGATETETETETETKFDILIYECDVTSAEEVAAAYAAAKARFGRLDYSVQCAALAEVPGTSLECSVDMFDRHMSVTYRGLWLCSREAIRIMREQSLDADAYPAAAIPKLRAQCGAILNVSSAEVYAPQRRFTAYCAAKTAILAVTQSDALDFAEDRIRVNTILPGLTDTESMRQSPEHYAWITANTLQRTPMKRWAAPEEVADLCVFLCGNRASYITGAHFVVDGGLSAGHV